MCKSNDNLTDKQKMFCDIYKSTYSFDIALKSSEYNLPEYNKLSNKYYVYFLLSDNNIFYVGKGKGNRMFQHKKEAFKDKTYNYLKIDKIKNSKNFKEVVFYYCKNETEAFKIERFFIENLKDYGLTNIMNGIHTSQENILSKCNNMINKMKSFRNWCDYIELNPTKKNVIINVFGSLEACYYSFIDNIKEIKGKLSHA